MHLRTVPFDLDAAAIAKGLLELFDEDERDRLRLSLLPADKMECLKRGLRAKFLEESSLPAIPDNELGLKQRKDQYVAMVRRSYQQPGFDFIEFCMRDLVEEATHAIVVELYRIGQLVV